MNWLKSRLDSVSGKLDFGSERSLEFCLNGKSACEEEGDAGEKGGADDKNVVAVSKQINKTLLKLYGSHLSEDGATVDYQGISESDVFKNQFIADVSVLPRLDVTALDQTQRKAFFLNVYNILEIHSTVAVMDHRRVPENPPIDMKKFKKKACYRIGPHLYTLGDIEHGCLRGNRRPPYVPFRLFDSDDPRLATICSPLDPRIHFALNCGAKSCPPIRLYDEANLDRALDMATAQFCASEDNLRVDSANNRVFLSEIFRWYSADFDVKDTDWSYGPALEFVVRFLDDANPTKEALTKLMQSKSWSVKPIPYNWESNKK